MKTFDQCKDEVAKIHGYHSWASMMFVFIDDKYKRSLEKVIKEAAELYAQEVAKDAWERACDEVAKRWEYHKFEVLQKGGSMKSFSSGICLEVKKDYQPNQEKP